MLEAVQQRLDENPQAMRQRRVTAEHPFATLKMRMGATHFLMKTPVCAASHAKISRRRLDELTEKRCNYYRQMMGCTLSGPRRVRPVIVGCSTASPAQVIAISMSDGCSLVDGSDGVAEKLGS